MKSFREKAEILNHNCPELSEKFLATNLAIEIISRSEIRLIDNNKIEK